MRRDEFWETSGVLSKKSAPYLRPLWVSLLIFACVAESIAADNAQQALMKIGGNASAGTARWCGPDSKTIVWQGVTSGIHLANILTGKVDIITKSWRHVDPFCSPDGRFVLFTDQAMGKTIAYDLNTSISIPIACLNEKVFLSPDIKVAASVEAQKCDSVSLPWGDAIPIRKVTPKCQGEASVKAWFSENRKVALLCVEPLVPGALSQRTSVVIYDLESGKSTPLDLPHSPATVQFSGDGKNLFYIGWNRGGPRISTSSQMNLYQVNIEHVPHKPEEIEKNVMAFDVHSRSAIAILKGNEVLFITDSGKGATKGVPLKKFESFIKYSLDGKKLLLMKQNPFRGQEGPEGPPITSSVYVMFINQ